MGRTIHYHTKEAVTPEEFKRLREVQKEYNTRYNWKHGEIKLWKKSWILREPPLNALWGYTKVYRNDEDGKAVIQAIKKMSKATPRLTWILYDEGDLTGGNEIGIKKGKIIKNRA